MSDFVDCQYWWHSMTFDTDHCLIDTKDCLRKDCRLTEDKRRRISFEQSEFYIDMLELNKRYEKYGH